MNLFSGDMRPFSEYRPWAIVLPTRTWYCELWEYKIQVAKFSLTLEVRHRHHYFTLLTSFSIIAAHNAWRLESLTFWFIRFSGFVYPSGGSHCRQFHVNYILIEANKITHCQSSMDLFAAVILDHSDLLHLCCEMQTATGVKNILFSRTGI